MMTIGARIRFRGVLRQARTHSVLALAATNAAIERSEHLHTAAGLSGAHQCDQKNDRLMAERESATLIAINGLLERLRDASEPYGVCEECGRLIEPARVWFFPWTSRCEQHAEEQIQ